MYFNIKCIGKLPVPTNEFERSLVFETGEFERPKFDCSTDYPSQNIRIHHECEGRIEKSVPWIAVWHHKACRVMTNGDPEGQSFLSYPHTNNGFFFLLTTVFINLF